MSLTNEALRIQQDIYMMLRAHDGIRPGRAMWLPVLLDQLCDEGGSVLRSIAPGVVDEAVQSLVDMRLIEESPPGGQRYRLTDEARGLLPLFSVDAAIGEIRRLQHPEPAKPDIRPSDIPPTVDAFRKHEAVHGPWLKMIVYRPKAEMWLHLHLREIIEEKVFLFDAVDGSRVTYFVGADKCQPWVWSDAEGNSVKGPDVDAALAAKGEG